MSKKIIAFALAAVFAVSMPLAGPARADEISDLQAQIQSLLAQITQLQQQLNAAQGGTTTTTGLCISAGLKMGMKSDAVKTLQEGLKQDPAVYPEGLTTGYFGPLTKAAVIRFQEKYATEVLSPWGLTKGTGYVGQTTAAKFNALYCTPVAPTTTTTVAPEETTTTTTVPPAEGILSVSSAPVFMESNLDWGDTNKVVYAFKVKAQNSDITLKRVMIKITENSLLPWKAFSYITLNDGSNAIKGVEAVKDNFVENDFGHDYDLYFDGLNIVVPKGTEKTLTVTANVLDNPATSGGTGNYTFQLLANGIRGIDTAGLNQYNSSPVASHLVAVADSQTNTGSLEVKSNPSALKEGVILGRTDAAVDNQPVFVFDVKATNKDVTLKTVNVSLNTTSCSGDDIPAVKLYDGNTLLGSTSIVNTSSTFSDLALPISKDTTKTLTVKVDLKKAPTEGCTITPSVSNAGWSAIDSNDDIASISGSVTGKPQHVYTVAPTFSFVSGNVTPDSNSSANATAEIKFTVTANGGDVYIPNSVASDKIVVNYYGTSTATFTSGIIDTDATAGSHDNYLILEGNTNTFTVTVSMSTSTAGTTGLMGAKLNKIYWAESDTPITTATSTDWGFELFKSGAVDLH